MKIISLIFLMMLFAEAAEVYARAGGGNNWVGGGGGGGSFSSRRSSYRSSSWSGSSGRGSGSASGAEAVFGAMVFVTALAVIYLIEHRTRNDQQLNDLLESEERAWRSDRKPEGTARSRDFTRLQTDDPSFDLKAMQQRVASAFKRVQKAWSDEQLSSVRPLLSDGVYERFQIGLTLNRSQGFRNIFRNVEVHAVKLVDVRFRSHFDVATFSVRASGHDADINLRTGKQRRGGNTMFTEYWTFVRRSGAKTPAGKGLLEACCPACSAPAGQLDVNRCSSCGVISLGGQHDWILSEITQKNAPRERHANDESLAALEIRDPEFNLQALEDLASVMFWRLRAATNLQDASYLKTLMPDLPASFAPPAWDIGVGSVVFAGHKRVEENGQLSDRIKIQVAWQSAGARRFRTSLYLQRSGSARTPATDCMKSFVCASCQAPLTSQTDSVCNYCGSTTADAGKTWILIRWKDEEEGSMAFAA